jgi:hypothetical protein
MFANNPVVHSIAFLKGICGPQQEGSGSSNILMKLARSQLISKVTMTENFIVARQHKCVKTNTN